MEKTWTPFEELLAKTIEERHNCGEQIAEHIIDTYLPVIRELNDQHDGVRIQADRYYKAYKEDQKPKEWLEHIYRTNEIYNVSMPIKTQPSVVYRVSNENKSNVYKTARLPRVGYAMAKKRSVGNYLRRIGLRGVTKQEAIAVAKLKSKGHFKNGVFVRVNGTIKEELENTANKTRKKRDARTR